MINAIDLSFNSVWNYISNFQLKSVSDNQELKSIALKTYKQIYPILVWKDVLVNGKDVSNIDSTYIEESTGDISISYFLFIQGFYKPAYNSLRSYIENIIKFLFILTKKNIGTKYTNRLYAELKQHSWSPLCKNSLVNMYASYSELSLSVHSHYEYISMMKGLQSYPEFNKLLAENYQSITTQVVKNSNHLITSILFDTCQKSHHSQRDCILSALNKTQKKDILSRY